MYCGIWKWAKNVVTLSLQPQMSSFQNPFLVFSSVEYWVFTVVCMLYLAFGILSLTEAGTIEFRSQLLPTVLSLPLLHPLLSYFASPQPYLASWGVHSYQSLHNHWYWLCTMHMKNTVMYNAQSVVQSVCKSHNQKIMVLLMAWFLCSTFRPRYYRVAVMMVWVVYMHDIQCICDLVNPRRACAVRVTVVDSVCLSVCCHISPLERLFFLKTLSRTQRAAKVKKFVGFSLKPLCCRDPAFPTVVRPAYSAKVRTAWV